MIYTIENKFLRVSADTSGAQLQSVYSKITNTEYLWQGDPAYWSGRAYNLFPVIGRMQKGSYLYDGVEYPIRLHGVARFNVFRLENRTATKLTFLLKDNEDIQKEYPFSFEFRVTFKLEDNKLTTEYDIKNTGDKTMICAVGGHPGFNIPFAGGDFEDYYLEFNEKTVAKSQLKAPSGKFMLGRSAQYYLQDGVRIPLEHKLFDNDAIILGNTARCVSIKNEKNDRRVTVRFDDFKYVGFWHTPMTDAPFVCIEPWTALPAIENVEDVLETKQDMMHIPPHKGEIKSFVIEIHE